MSLLSKLLGKRGIEKEEDLSIEEKVVFDKYKAILTGEAVSVQVIKDFCRLQIRIIEEKFASHGYHVDDTYLKACLHVYLNLLKTIEAPEAERESLELYLAQLIKE